MAAFTQLIPLPTSLEIVEVLTARTAICFAKELGFENVIYEGDSEIFINAINNEDLSSSSLAISSVVSSLYVFFLYEFSFLSYS